MGRSFWLLILTITLISQTKSDIVLAQSAALSGSSKLLGLGMKEGLEAAFLFSNNRGGIRGGENVTLKTYDDGYEPINAKYNAGLIANDSDVFMMVGQVGTPTSVAILNSTLLGTGPDKIPFIGAYTGSMSLRVPFDPYVVNIRASYVDETQAMVTMLNNIFSVQRISIFYQNDSYGISGLDGLTLALGALGLPLESRGTYERNSEDIQAGLDLILNNGNPEAIVMIGTYAALAKFVSECRNIEKSNVTYFLTVSFVGAEPFAEQLKNYNESTENIFVTQVVPTPTNMSYPLIQEFKQALDEYNSSATPTFINLEGFIVGKFILQTLDNLWLPLTRENYINHIYNSKYVSLNEFLLGPFGQESKCNQGMRQVFVTHIQSDYTYTLFPPFSSYSFSNCGNASLVPQFPIVFGQSAPFTGTSRDLGITVKSGVEAAFNKINLDGGLIRNEGSPKKLYLVSMDDQYEPNQALDNVKAFLNNTQLFAFLCNVGTPTAQVTLPLTTAANIPVIGSYTGAKLLRDPPQRSIVNIRAGYTDETSVMVQFLIKYGVRRIGLFWQNDTFGQTVGDALKLALTEFRLSIVSNGTYVRNTENVKDGLEKILIGDPEAVVMVGTAKPLAKFVAQGKGSESRDFIPFLPKVKYYLTVSFVGSESFAQALSEYGVETDGIIITQVVPNPRNTSSQIVVDYQNAMNQLYENPDYNYPSLEGYISARFVYKVLQLTSATNLTKDAFLDTLYNEEYISLNDISLGPFNNKCNQGMRMIWVTTVDSNYTVVEPPNSAYELPTCGISYLEYYDCQTHTIYLDKYKRINTTLDSHFINASLVCDGFFDCPDLSDEYYAGPRCQRNIYTSWVAWLIIVIILIAIIVAIIIFVHIQSNRMVLKASSPPFLITMLIGMIIVLASVPILVLPTSDFMCSFQIWLPNIGITLTLASLLVKSWRIDKIFNMKTLKRAGRNPSYSNLGLARIITVLMVIDIILLIIWTSADRVKPKMVPHPQQPGAYQYTCTSDNFYTMAAVLLGYYLCLLAWGIYLAYRTRNTDARFNESTAIAIAIYQFIFLFGILIPLFILEPEPIFRFNVGAAFLVISNLVIMAAIFLKKVYLVVKGKENGEIAISGSKKSGTSTVLEKELKELRGIWNNGDYGTDDELLHKIKSFFQSSNNSLSILSTLSNANSVKKSELGSRARDNKSATY